jgi:ribosomal protein L37AE/L43A
MLWDGSNRPIELLSLNWQDLKSDEYGYSFKTSAKTGKERHIRLTISIPYLEAWRRDYPGNAKGENPVFVSVKRPHAKWTMMAAKAMIKELRKITGLENLKLSIFRPSRITHDVKSGYDLPFLMMKNWGNMKTPMIDLYTNIGMDYIDQTALRKAGMERVEKAKETEQYQIEVPICPICHTLNISGSLFCSTCRTPLTAAAKEKVTSTERTIDAEMTEEDFIQAAKEMYARRKAQTV